ncbi:HAD family hydrolase [Gordonia sp. CPCC 205515]|uniref:HAD family hydrolase n=1 Tax=Gordonia sp. CPCC 205515 TaxID=3140791 RepID=UPI003AF3A613
MGDEQFASAAPQCVEIYQDAPISYMTERSMSLLSDLSASVPVVPTTTRTATQFGRVSLPGSPFPYAVVSNGGRILVDGVDDMRWRAGIERVLRECRADLDTVVANLRSRIDDSWVKSLRIADDLFCYLVVDLAAQPGGFLEEWSQWCQDRDWTVSQQGRKIYAMPRCVTKSAAVAEVRRRLIESGRICADASLVAAGDGWLDADLLESADRAIRPRHGELHHLEWNRDHVRVTAQSGALAGEEILEWFLGQVHNSHGNCNDTALEATR